MNIDSFLISLDKTIVSVWKAQTTNERLLYKAMGTSGIGVFKWDLDLGTFMMSEKMFSLLGVDWPYSGSLFKLLETIIDNQTLFMLVRQMMTTYSKKVKGEVDFKAHLKKCGGQHDFRAIFDIDKEGHLIIGTLEDISELKKAQLESAQAGDRLLQVLKTIPLPMYYYDPVGNLVFSNETLVKKHEYLNPLIEKHVSGISQALNREPSIKEYDIQLFESNHRKYRLNIRHQDKLYVLLVHRIVIMERDHVNGILYIHEDITDDYEHEHQIKKVLKTNELTIQIKDIVDQDVDISVLYDFVLENISSVIPSVKRACILKIDLKGDLYMAANYGYDDGYQATLHMPFEDTYAYSELKGDYSKSIIINDVQKKYASVYPDINEKQNGFIMESNMTAPIMISNKLYGILSVDTDINHIFDPVDLNLIDYIRIQLERSISKHNLLNRYKAESISDPLTGVFNRRHLMDVFDSLILKGKHELKNFAVVLFDIDKLKQVNDQHGHLVGDTMLKVFSMKVLRGSRSDDILSRYGGDEFVGLFWDMATKDLITRIARWQDELNEELITSSDPSLRVSFSYGISLYPSDGEEFDDLLNIADQRMYTQKNKKKDK